MKQVSNNVISGGEKSKYVDFGDTYFGEDMGGTEDHDQEVRQWGEINPENTISHKVAKSLGINKVCSGLIESENKLGYYNNLKAKDKAICTAAFGVRRIGDILRGASKAVSFTTKGALGTGINVVKGVSTPIIGKSNIREQYIPLMELKRNVKREGGKRKSKKSRKSTKKTKKTKTRRSKK